MAATSADYATVITACRRCLANGTQLSGKEMQLVIDVVQHGSSNEKDTAAAALEALLVTHLDTNWVAVGTSDSAAVRTAALAALATPRTAAVAGAVITDIAADDRADGRSA